jgi:hypothetical protein
VIFICHTPLIYELADAVLTIGGGSVFTEDQGVAITKPRSASLPAMPNSQIT